MNQSDDFEDDDPMKHWPIDWASADLRLDRWYVVPGNPEGHTSEGAWTISPDPQRPGWATDSGCAGYGMPRAVAEDVVRRLNATAKGASLIQRLLASEPELPPEIEDMTMIYPTDDQDDPIPWDFHVRLAKNGDWYVGTAPSKAKPLRWVRITTSGSRCPGVAPAIAEAFKVMGRMFFVSEVGQRYLDELREGRHG